MTGLAMSKRIIYTIILAFALLYQLSSAAHAQDQQAAGLNNRATLKGRVFDARSGEPIAKVKVIVVASQRAATTDEHGSFLLEGLPIGEVELYITTVTYGLVRRSLRLGEGPNEYDITLNQDAATLAEQVTVTADSSFEGSETNVASEQMINKAELRTLSTVILGDPVRAAQALPSAAATDDFRSEFSVRGAGFDRVGLYIDGALVDAFIHTVQGGYLDSGSLSVLNADTVSAVSLMGGAFPSKYGYRTAAILNVEMREGNRVRSAGRIAASLSNLSAVVDGPFRRGSYLLAARKSYLGPLVRRINESNDNNEAESIIFDFADLQGKLIYDLSARHRFGFSAIFGDSQFDRDRDRNRLGSNAVREGRTRSLLVNAHWSFTPDARTIASARIFGLRNSFNNENRDNLQLGRGVRNQLGARADINYLARGAHRVEAGFYARSVREDRLSQRFCNSQPTAACELWAYDRRTTEPSFYAQDTWTSERFGLSLTGGLRAEHSTLTGETFVSPRASLGLTVRNNWRVRAGAGSYRQFPDFEQLFGPLGDERLRSARATHYNAVVERIFGERTRASIEVYDREDRRLFFSLSEPRVAAGRLNFAELPYRNAVNGHARGVELSLQRRSANNLTGWISYAYSQTRLRDEQSGLAFPSDYDQRHTINLYASYRLTETFNLSGQWRYGSGFPIPGFFRRINNQLNLSDERNRARVPAYARLDVRAGKAFLFKRSKLTLYGEILNLLNRENRRFAGFDGYGSRGEVFGRLDKTLPILPSVGLTFEF